MKSILVAVLGLSLAFAPGAARADIVTDWNLTTHEVMKVAKSCRRTGGAHPGHGACRDVRRGQLGAEPLHALRRQRCLPHPDASAEAAAAAARAADPGPTLSQQKAMIEDAYAASIKAIPDGPAKTQGIALGEQVAAAVLADRATDGTNVPDTYRPITSPGVWVPTAPPITEQYARAQALGPEERRPVPAGPAAATDQRALRPRLQRDEDVGGAKSTARTRRADRCGEVLDAGQSRPRLAGGGAPARGREGTRLAENAPAVRAPQHGRRQQLHHRLGCEIHLQFLAAGHRDPQRRHGRQRRHRARCRLDPAERRRRCIRNTRRRPASLPASRSACWRRCSGPTPASRSPRPISPTRSGRGQFDEHRGHGRGARNVRVWGGIHFRNSLEVGDDMGRKIAAYLIDNALKPRR